jgi:hypothetical protein
MRDPQGRELLTTPTPMRLAMEAAVTRLATTGTQERIAEASALFREVNPKAGFKKRPAWTVSRREPKRAGRGR